MMAFELRVNKRYGLFAMSEYGKSVLGNFLVRKLSEQGEAVVIYNTDYESPKFDSKNVVVHDPPPSKMDDLEELNRFILGMREASNFSLYIRDLDVFFDNTNSANKMAKELKSLVSNGRHQRIGVIYESKQLKYIPTKVISNTNVIFFGNFSEIDDIKRLKNFATKQEIISLKSPYFIMYNRDTSERWLVHIDMDRDVLVKDLELKPLVDVI